jgi:hypothetical protein
MHEFILVYRRSSVNDWRGTHDDDGAACGGPVSERYDTYVVNSRKHGVNGRGANDVVTDAERKDRER